MPSIYGAINLIRTKRKFSEEISAHGSRVDKLWNEKMDLQRECSHQFPFLLSELKDEYTGNIMRTYKCLCGCEYSTNQYQEKDGPFYQKSIINIDMGKKAKDLVHGEKITYLAMVEFIINMGSKFTDIEQLRAYIGLHYVEISEQFYANTHFSSIEEISKVLEESDNKTVMLSPDIYELIELIIKKRRNDEETSIHKRLSDELLNAKIKLREEKHHILPLNLGKVYGAATKDTIKCLCGLEYEDGSCPFDYESFVPKTIVNVDMGAGEASTYLYHIQKMYLAVEEFIINRGLEFSDFGQLKEYISLHYREIYKEFNANRHVSTVAEIDKILGGTNNQPLFALTQKGFMRTLKGIIKPIQKL